MATHAVSCDEYKRTFVLFFPAAFQSMAELASRLSYRDETNLGLFINIPLPPPPPQPTHFTPASPSNYNIYNSIRMS